MINWREPVKYQTILNLTVSDENLLFDLRDVSYTLLYDSIVLNIVLNIWWSWP